MGVLTQAELREFTAEDVEHELRSICRQLDENERERADLEENRYRLFKRAERLGISQRQMAPWVGLTNARVAQIAKGESPGKRAAAARKTAADVRKARAEAAKNKRPPGRPRKVVEPETTDA